MANAKEEVKKENKERKAIKERKVIAKAIVLSYRRGLHKQNTRQLLVKVKGVEDKENAKKFVGKKILVKLKKKEFLGKVTRLHGNKGVLRVQFYRGLPGQVLGKEAFVVE